MKVASRVAVAACLAVLVAATQGAPDSVRVSGIEVEPTSIGAIFRFRDWVLSVSDWTAVISYVGAHPIEDELMPARATLSLPVGSELPPMVEDESLPEAIAVSVQTARGIARTLLEEQRVLTAYVDEPVLANLRALSHGRFRVQAEATGGELEMRIAAGYCGDARYASLEASRGRYRVRARIGAEEWEVSGEMWKLDSPPRSRWMEIAQGKEETSQPEMPDQRFRIRRLADGRIVLTESFWSAAEALAPMEVAREYLRKVRRAMDAGLIETEEFASDEVARVLTELSRPPDAVITEEPGADDA